MRGDPTRNQMGSLLFPTQPNQANQVPVPASQVASYGTSTNHPLSVVAERPPEVVNRLRPSGSSYMPPQQHNAGRAATRGESSYSVITGGEPPEPAPFMPGRRAAPRTAYEHPTYQIGCVSIPAHRHGPCSPTPPLSLQARHARRQRQGRAVRRLCGCPAPGAGSR